MKQCLLTALIATFVYLAIVDLGSFVFSVTEGVVSTLWESPFFFLFIFLLLGYRNNRKKQLQKGLTTTLRKSSLLILVTYAITFFGPLLFSGISPNAATNVTTALCIIGAFIMIGIFLKTTEPSPSGETATLKSSIFILSLGISGTFIAMLVQGVTFVIEVAITGERTTSQSIQTIIAVILVNPLLILVTTIGGLAMEEFVFRYAFIHLIQPFTNFWIMATVSSAIFSLAHADGHFFVYFSMGFFFAPLYKQTGKIWTSIIAHCGMNTIVIIARLFLYNGTIQ